MDSFFPFIHKKKKDFEQLPLYVELYPPPPNQEDKKETEELIIIIQL